MRVGDVYQSKFLRGSDLQRAVTVTIARVVLEQIGDDRKLVVYFDGAKKALALNRTNATSIAELVGSDDTDRWAGARITLRPVPVLYQGRTVPAIRVDARRAETALPPRPREPEPAPDAFTAGGAGGELTASDIPF